MLLCHYRQHITVIWSMLKPLGKNFTVKEMLLLVLKDYYTQFYTLETLYIIETKPCIIIFYLIQVPSEWIPQKWEVMVNIW